jgi:hypothetical protein
LQQGHQAKGVVIVTYFDAAAARRASRRAALIVLALAAPTLGGCESSGGGLFGSAGEAPQASAAPAASAGAAQASGPAAAPQGQAPRIALAPIMGAPDAVSKQLGERLVEAVEKQKVGMSRDKSASAEYTLRGYVVAAKDPVGTKLSYIWDVTDKVGTKRHHRIQGEELLKGSEGADPWAAVDAKAIQALADKTSAGLLKWLPAAPAQPPAQPAVAAAGSRPAATPAAASQQTTASIPKGEVATFVPNVSGAPGDGSTALAAALRRELQKASVSLSDAAGSGTYKVQGKVAVGQPAGGKQSIRIEWLVTDPAGRKLGTVSQKNEVPQGSLDRAWGQTADAAAAAAAQGIAKLLPARATN